MAPNRPRGRQRNVTGPGKPVHRRGSSLGTGPVGGAGRGAGIGGGSPRPTFHSSEHRNPNRSSGGGGGLIKIVVLVLVLLLGGGTGVGTLLGGSGTSENYYPNQNPSYEQQMPSMDLEALLGSLGGGNVSSGWNSGSNTGALDTTVASGARQKYTKILGNGKDEMTILLYLCGTDLESRSAMATSDLQEMLNAGIGDNVNLIVYTGGCRKWQNNVISNSTNQIWQVTAKGLACLDKDAGSKSMTDPATLSSFIRWGAKKFPANRMALIFWDHGGGSVSGYG